ncbi:hypothetical protein K438DRAFT_1996149 [Mycena galopus ATCC 62051]|nr:hypothetical protein K438DRAFT_1996149 [Mycena galopus ATCC 62051]
MTYVLPPKILGPTLLGILFNWGFLGVSVVQLYFYHENFRHDRAPIKLLVYVVALLDVLQTVMMTADAFHWFVYGFDSLIASDQPFLNSWDVPVLDSIIALIVQAFYCWRIYILRKGFVIPLAVLLVSLTQFAAGIATGIKVPICTPLTHSSTTIIIFPGGHQLGHLSLIFETAASETVWLAGGAVADVAIAGVLSWTLLRKRKHSLPPNHTIISRLIRHTVETNALTASVAVIAVILFWGAQDTALVATPVNQRSHGMVSLPIPGPNLDLPRHSTNSHHHAGSMKVHVQRQTDSSYESVHGDSYIQKPSPTFAQPRSA